MKSTKLLTINEALSLDLFKDIIDKDEFIRLNRSFSDFPIEKHELNLGHDNFAHWHRILVEKQNRRGEIAFAIANEDNNYLVHTKSFYPNGIYRIPTGGIKVEEPVVDAFQRELLEETGFSSPPEKLFGVILYVFKYAGQQLPFASYLFKVRVKNEEPLPQDSDEDISGFKWVDLDGIARIVKNLKNIGGGWQDWGRMRSIPHELLLQSEQK